MPMNLQAQKRGAKGALDMPRGRSPRPMRQTDAPSHDGRLVHRASNISQEGSAKVTLASKLNELLDESGLSQSAAARLLGMPQPKVSAIRNYKLRGISLERLMQALLALNQQVEIIVKPGRKAGISSIRVAV